MRSIILGLVVIRRYPGKNFVYKQFFEDELECLCKCRYFQQKGQEAGAGKLLTNIQQWQNVCPFNLSKWDGGFDGKDAF